MLKAFEKKTRRNREKSIRELERRDRSRIEEMIVFIGEIQ